MSKPRFAAGIVCVLHAAIALAGCTSVSARTARAWHPQTYAIVVADDQGVLPQATFKKVEIAIVQYLMDGGFVRSDERYTGDLMRADVVFRIRIAWQNTAATSFTVAEIAPSYTNGAPVPTAVAEVEPDYGPWYDDPWFSGDYYSGFAYGPWCPFLGVAAFLPVYGFDHHRHPFPPVAAHRPPADDMRREHRPPNGYTRYSPRPGDGVTPPYYHRPPSAPDNDHPVWPTTPSTHRRDNDSNRPTPAPNASSWRSRSPAPGTPPPPASSARGQRNSDSPGRTSAWRGRDSGSNPYQSSRSSDAPHYSAPPAQSNSAPAAPSYSAPTYSAPASSSPPPAASSSSSSGNRDTNSRTQQR